METVLKYLNMAIDIRQEKKARHKMGDIIALVFFSMLSNADGWEEVEIFGKEHEKFCAGTWNCHTEYPLTIQ